MVQLECTMCCYTLDIHDYFYRLYPEIDLTNHHKSALPLPIPPKFTFREAANRYSIKLCGLKELLVPIQSFRTKLQRSLVRYDFSVTSLRIKVM